jgi:hypothetical protein
MSLIGIIGPTKVEDPDEINCINERLSEILINKGYSAIINPTLGSAPGIFGHVFKKKKEEKLNGHSHLVGIIYDDAEQYGGYGLERDLCEQNINCKTWENQPKLLVEISKHIICLGISTGTVWEICLTKFYWHLKKLDCGENNPSGKVFIIEELSDKKLIDCLIEKLKMKEYVFIISINDLENKL